MENANIIFKDKNTNKSIEINLQYDKDTSNIDYDVNIDKSYSANSKLDFIGFLAKMFLEMLNSNK